MGKGLCGDRDQNAICCEYSFGIETDERWQQMTEKLSWFLKSLHAIKYDINN